MADTDNSKNQIVEIVNAMESKNMHFCIPHILVNVIKIFQYVISSFFSSRINIFLQQTCPQDSQQHERMTKIEQRLTAMESECVKQATNQKKVCDSIIKQGEQIANIQNRMEKIEHLLTQLINQENRQRDTCDRSVNERSFDVHSESPSASVKEILSDFVREISSPTPINNQQEICEKNMIEPLPDAIEKSSAIETVSN